MTDAATGQDREPVDALLDLFVFAPIGLVLDAQTVTPDLAARGRQHAVVARQIGEMAVKVGVRKVEDAITSIRSDRAGEPATTATTDKASSAAPEPVADIEPGEPTKAEAEAEAESDATATEAGALAIPDYDTLAASQVVKRLDALEPADLEAVRAYEAATRSRRTILTKIARLQG